MYFRMNNEHMWTVSIRFDAMLDAAQFIKYKSIDEINGGMWQ